MHLLFVLEMARLLISSLENRKKRRRNKRGKEGYHPLDSGCGLVDCPDQRPHMKLRNASDWMIYQTMHFTSSVVPVLRFTHQISETRKQYYNISPVGSSREVKWEVFITIRIRVDWVDVQRSFTPFGLCFRLDDSRGPPRHFLVYIYICVCVCVYFIPPPLRSRIAAIGDFCLIHQRDQLPIGSWTVLLST